MKKVASFVVVILALSFSYLLGFYKGKSFEGYRISRVVDGDTLGVVDLRTGRDWRMRLWGIDAPEAKECGATAAKEELEKIVGGKNAVISMLGVDGFGRLIGRVWVSGDEVAILLAQKGMGVVEPSSERLYDDKKPDLAIVGELRRQEEDAITNGLGIWSKECLKK